MEEKMNEKPPSKPVSGQTERQVRYTPPKKKKPSIYWSTGKQVRR